MTDKIQQQLIHYSHETPDGRSWTKRDMAAFHRWFKKFLKRNPKIRNEFINCPKGVNNTDAVLEVFSTEFIKTVPFNQV